MSSRQPLPRDRHAAVGVGRKLYIWAGDSPSKIEASAIEVFDVSSETWHQPQHLCTSLPDGLQDVAVTTDGVYAYSFGGIADSFLNTVYKVRLSDKLVCAELPPKNSPCAPEKKSGCRVVYYNEKLVVHGGWTGPDQTDELNVLDIRTGVWSQQPTTGEKPPKLSGHTFTRIDEHRAVVFGGKSWSCKLEDTFVLDMKTWVIVAVDGRVEHCLNIHTTSYATDTLPIRRNWSKVKLSEESGVKPLNREYHAACCIAGPLIRTGEEHPLLMVIGGRRDDMRIVDDVWILDVDAGVWSEVTLPGSITPRHGHSAVMFENGSSLRVVVLFGGKQPSRLLDHEGCHISDTTLLLLEHTSHVGITSWEVARVVRTDLREQINELECRLREEEDKRTEVENKLEQRLKEEEENRAEMKSELEQKLREEVEKRTDVESQLEQRLREEQEKRVEREQQMERRISVLEQHIQDLSSKGDQTDSNILQHMQGTPRSSIETPTKLSGRLDDSILAGSTTPTRMVNKGEENAGLLKAVKASPALPCLLAIAVGLCAVLIGVIAVMQWPALILAPVSSKSPFEPQQPVMTQTVHVEEPAIPVTGNEHSGHSKEVIPENKPATTTVYDQGRKNTARGKVCTEIKEVRQLCRALREFSQWKQLGTELGISQAKMGMIETDNADTESRKQALLQTWFDKHDKVCWEALVSALRGMDQVKLAKKVADEYGIAWTE